jgi:hypothetical protein
MRFFFYGTLVDPEILQSTLYSGEKRFYTGIVESTGGALSTPFSSRTRPRRFKE